MLRYDHSKQILEGLLGSHFLYDVNDTEPIKDSNGEYKYGKTTIDFPQPQYGGSSEVTFQVGDGAPYPYRAEVSFYTPLQKPLKNRETYVVYWRQHDFPFVCTSYLSRKDQAEDKRTDDDSTKNYYLGNPTILEDNTGLDLPDSVSDIVIEEFDENIPFFIWIEGKKNKIHIYKKDWDPDIVSFGFYKRPEPEIYIGLFTVGPDHNGENGREPGREVLLYDSTTGEPIIDEATGEQKTEYQLWPEYLRVQLNVLSRFDRTTPLLKSAEIVDEHPQVSNQDMILFPEAIGDWEEETGWGKITHFGLFYGQKDNLDQQVPFLWGEITGENNSNGVTIGFQEVPVIRKNGLKILLE